MKLVELFETNKVRSKDFFKQGEEFDSVFNREAFQNKKKQEQYYKENNMTGDSTPVFRAPTKAKEEDLWSTDPKQPENELQTSSGYIGRENTKRRAGIPHDKKVPQHDPHSDVAYSSVEEEEIIKKAEKALGRDHF